MHIWTARNHMLNFSPCPFSPPQESSYRQNHLDSVGAHVFEVSPQSFCILGIVSSLDHDAALHPCGDEGRPHTRLCCPEHRQHVKGRLWVLHLSGCSKLDWTRPWATWRSFGFRPAPSRLQDQRPPAVPSHLNPALWFYASLPRTSWRWFLDHPWINTCSTTILSTNGRTSYLKSFSKYAEITASDHQQRH